MRFLFLLLLFPFLPGCQYSSNNGNVFHDIPGDSANWRRLEFDGFSMKAPGDWVRYSLRGFDSYVGGITNGKDSLEFDYGMYSAEVDTNGQLSSLYSTAAIDGFPAVIRIPKTSGEGPCELHIDLTGDNKFMFNGYVHDNQTAISIYQSLYFSDGHPAETDSLMMDRFSNAFPYTGKTLFVARCSQCHQATRMDDFIFSPEYLKNRSNDWIYRFLAHRNELKPDKLALGLKAAFNGAECPEQPDLKRSDVYLMMNWRRKPRQ